MALEDLLLKKVPNKTGFTEEELVRLLKKALVEKKIEAAVREKLPAMIKSDVFRKKRNRIVSAKWRNCKAPWTKGKCSAKLKFTHTPKCAKPHPTYGITFGKRSEGKIAAPITTVRKFFEEKARKEKEDAQRRIESHTVRCQEGSPEEAQACGSPVGSPGHEKEESQGRGKGATEAEAEVHQAGQAHRRSSRRRGLK